MQILKNLNYWDAHHHRSYGKNIIQITYKNDKEKYIELSDSQMKLFKLYNNTSWDFRTDELSLTKSELKLEKLLNDPTNYYKQFSYTLSYKEIKDIFENKDNQLSIEDLRIYLETKDYLYLLNHSNIDLSTGVTDQNNKYKNVLTDLKDQLIPNWAKKELPIGELFKLKQNFLEFKMDTLQNIESSYYDYFGNSNTYKAFKDLLKIYIDGISLYLYKDEILTFSEFADKYDKTSRYYQNIKVSNLFEYTWVNRIVDLDPEVQELEYKCISVNDPKDLLKDYLSKLEINLKLKNNIKNKIIKPKFITELYNYNLVQKELLNIWF